MGKDERGRGKNVRRGLIKSFCATRQRERPRKRIAKIHPSCVYGAPVKEEGAGKGLDESAKLAIAFRPGTVAVFSAYRAVALSARARATPQPVTSSRGSRRYRRL